VRQKQRKVRFDPLYAGTATKPARTPHKKEGHAPRRGEEVGVGYVKWADAISCDWANTWRGSVRIGDKPNRGWRGFRLRSSACYGVTYQGAQSMHCNTKMR
jgi:hypothetical protein